MIKARVLAVAVVLTVESGPAIAQQAPWCLYETAGDGGGAVNCGFHSFAQCQASRPGGSSHCVRNPALPSGPRTSIEGPKTGRDPRR